MFSNIVLATDGSEHSDRALRYATQMAERDGAGLNVVHVVEKLLGPRVAGANARADEDELVQKIKDQVAALEAEHEISVVANFTSANGGAAADRIAEIADDTGADLIVVGTRGHSALTAAILGSVTQRLLHLASCPVLAVPPLRATLKTAEPGKATAVD